MNKVKLDLDHVVCCVSLARYITLLNERYATEGCGKGGQPQLFLPELGVASKYVTRGDPKFLILSYSFSISCLYRILQNIS